MNTMATSNEEIVDMLTRSSAAMAIANNTIQETIALESAAVEITRNAETTGTAFKTVSMRVRGYDEETEELSDDLRDISGVIADLTKVNGKSGISLFTDETNQTYKSTYQILKEIAERWDEISDKNQAALLEKIAGKRGGQVVGGLLTNFNAVEKALKEMENAAGSADAEMEIIQESIDYKLNALKETWVGVAQTLIDRGTIGQIVDGFTRISEAIGLVVEKAGLLGSLGVMGGAYAGFNNVNLAGEMANGAVGLFNGIKNIPNSIKNIPQVLRDNKLTKQWNAALEDVTDATTREAISTQFLADNQTKLSESLYKTMEANKGVAITEEMVTKTTTAATTATKLFTAALNMAVVFAAAYAIKWAANKLNEYIVTTKEASEKVNNLSASLKNLKGEFEDLSSKQDLTPEEKARLDYLEKRIELEEKLLAIAEREKADKDLGNSRNYVLPGTFVIDKDSLEYQVDKDFADWTSSDYFYNGTSSGATIFPWERQYKDIISDASKIEYQQKKLAETADHSGDYYAQELAKNYDIAEDVYEELLQKYTEFEDKATAIQASMLNENLTEQQKQQYQEYLDKYQEGIDKMLREMFDLGLTFMNPEWIIEPDIKLDLSNVPVSEIKQAYEDYIQQIYEKYWWVDQDKLDMLFGLSHNADTNPLYNEYAGVARFAAEKFGDYTEEYANGNMQKTYDLSFMDKIASKLNIQTSEQIGLLQQAIGKSQKRTDIEKEYQNVVSETTELLDYANKKDKSNYTSANYVDDAQSEIKQLGDVLRQLQDNTLDESSLIDFYQDFPEFQNITTDLQEAIKTKLVGSIADLEKATGKKLSPELRKSLEELVYSATNANRTLNESFNQAKSSFEAYNELQKKLAKGEVIDSSMLSTIAGLSDRLDTMVAGYYGGVVTIEEITEELNNQRQRDFENYKETYVRKQNLDDQYYKNAITSKAELVNTYNKLYHTDLENYNNFEEAKLKTFNAAISQRADTLAKFFNLSQSQMESMLSKYYDYENNEYTQAYWQLYADARSGGKQAEHANVILAQVEAYVADYKAGYEQLKQFGMNADNLIDAEGFAKNLSNVASSYKELFDFFERRIEVINQALEKLDASLEEVNGSMSKNILIAGKMGIVSEEIKDYASALTMYQQKASEELAKLPEDLQNKIKNGAIDITTLLGENGEEVNKVLEDYKKWADKVNDCNQQLIALKETLRDLALDKFNNIAQDYTDQFDIIESSKSLIDKQISVFEEAGQLIGKAFYESQIDATRQQKTLLENEKAALIQELSSSISSGYIQKGTDEWLEMVKAIQEVDENILDCDQTVEQLQNSILELNDKTFERLQKSFSDIKSQLSNIIGMISDIDVSSEDGIWSDEGLTQLGAYAQQYELASHNVEKYQEEIDKLNDSYANGLYSTTEYLDKLSDLTQSQWDEANAAEDAKKSILELNKARVEIIKTGIQKQIDKYKELIDKQKEALDKEKDLHDYEKTIAEKNKNIEKIQRQLTALANDDSAAAVAKRIKLQQELADATSDLEEAQYDHSVEVQKEALDQQQKDFEDARQKEIDDLEEYLKDVDQVQKDSFALIKANTELIAKTVDAIARDHGVYISETITKAWKDGENAIASYEQTLNADSSAFISELTKIEGETVSLQNQADFTANALSDMLSVQATNLLSELHATRDSINDITTATNLLKSSLISTLSGGYDISRIIGAMQQIIATSADVQESLGDTDGSKRAKEILTSQQKNIVDKVSGTFSNVTNGISNLLGINNNGNNESDLGTKINTNAKQQELLDYQNEQIKKRDEKYAKLEEAWDLFAYKTYYSNEGSYSSEYETLAREAQYSQGAGQLKNKIDRAIAEYKAEIERIKNQYPGYATGVHNLGSSQYAWTQEYGSEAILSPTRNAILTKLNKGDTVLTKEQTDNLFKLSNLNIGDVFGKGKIHSISSLASPVLEIGNIVTVNGNIDDTNINRMRVVAENAVVSAFKKFSSEITKR